MAGFADRTGLTSGRPPVRYLWTDAFAVCNFLDLARLTGEPGHVRTALRLVDQVHHVLGRFRSDDARRGWISGLGEAEGEAHPTRGGLRIGKRLPERGVNDPYDERAEWDRDGQYFHYLTKWMHALDQVSRATGDSRFNGWARELAETAHAAFTRDGRMVWKASTDLTRPLVPSMGQHDPLDGFVTCLQLRSTAASLPAAANEPDLDAPLASYAAMLRAIDLRTADPLGLGGLLADAWRVAQLGTDGGLLDRLLASAQPGLALWIRQREWLDPPEQRLAFRELGLAIGLEAVDRLARATETRGGSADAGRRARVRGLGEQTGLAGTIVASWLDPRSQRSTTWTDHRDIDEVMLATALVPAGYLDLLPPPD
jgi:hypothetical protein